MSNVNIMDILTHRQEVKVFGQIGWFVCPSDYVKSNQ